jgi:hypothetical protein
MADQDFARQLGNIKAVLESVENQVARGKVPPDGLEQIKSSVDDVRLRLWAIMSAASSGEYENFAQRFRLRRAIEIVQGIADDLKAGKIGSDHAEFETLARSTRSLMEALNKGA